MLLIYSLDVTISRSSCLCVNNNLRNPHFHEFRLFSVLVQGRMYKRRETIVARWYSCTIHGTETMATRHAESRSFVQKCVFLAFLFAIQVAGGGEESVYEKLVGGSFDFANLFTRYFSFRRRSVEILCKIFWFASNIFTNLNVKRSSANDGYLSNGSNFYI